MLYCFNGHGGLIRPPTTQSWGFWLGRMTHSPPDPRESRTLREEVHTWRAGHDTEDGGRYEEQPEAHTVCHRQRDEDSGETTQPEERPSIKPWRRQATLLLLTQCANSNCFKSYCRLLLVPDSGHLLITAASISVVYYHQWTALRGNCALFIV